jgi:hypothetical protein
MPYITSFNPPFGLNFKVETKMQFFMGNEIAQLQKTKADWRKPYEKTNDND